MKQTTITDGVLLIPAAGYLRMSTDDQKDSPERQRGEVVALAARDGFKIIRWYEDHGLTGTESKNRPAFQRMMADIWKGEFKAILVYEFSRFSREEGFEAMPHWKALRDAGVRLISVLKGEMRFKELGDFITNIVNQYGSHNESVQLAKRSLSGRKLKAAAGVHASTIPFGFDREILDESKTVVRRLTCRDRFKRPKSWTSKLVPAANTEEVDAVRYVFASAKRGVPMRAIAVELNRRCLTTVRKGPFDTQQIRRMLVNPVYTGLLRFGQNPRGKFDRCEEIIFVPNAHPALVSTAEFETVQSVMKAVYRQGGGSKGQPANYLLTKLMFCEHCGGRMNGASLTGPQWGEKGFRQYRCCWTDTGVEECEVHPTVSAERIEELVKSLILKHVLCEANRPQLAEAMQCLIQKTLAPSTEYAQLQGVIANIARAVKNLARAEDDDFAGISQELKVMREQERQLAGRVKAQTKTATKGVVALNGEDDLKFLRERLDLADRALLAPALRESISRITVGREREERDGVVFNHNFGSVTFNPEIYPHGPIQFDEEDLWGRANHKAIVKFVNAAPGGARTAEIAKQFNMSAGLAAYHAKRSVTLGLLSMRRDGVSFVFEPARAEKSGAKS